MLCNRKPSYYCAKCAFKIKSKDRINCTKRGCERNFHLICVGESDITEERRENWRCERCFYGFRIYGVEEPSTSQESPKPSPAGRVPASALHQPLPLAALAEMSQHQPAAQLRRVNSPPHQHLGQRQTNTLSKQVELYGVNKKEPESELLLMIKVMKIAKIINFNIKSEHVETVFRVPNPYIDFSPAHETVVIVRFINKVLRNIFLNKFKRMEFVSNGMIDNKDPNGERLIYAYENLNHRDKVIFTTARNRSLNLGYKYCWTLDGVTFVRKDDNSPMIKIPSLQVLDKYLPPCPDTESQK